MLLGLCAIGAQVCNGTVATDFLFASHRSNLTPPWTFHAATLECESRHLIRDLMILVGHADATEKNPRSLSLARANSVKRALIEAGFPENRIYVEAKGAKQPVADNRTLAGRAKNRRVEAELIYARNPQRQKPSMGECDAVIATIDANNISGLRSLVRTSWHKESMRYWAAYIRYAADLGKQSALEVLLSREHLARLLPEDRKKIFGELVQALRPDLLQNFPQSDIRYFLRESPPVLYSKAACADRSTRPRADEMFDWLASVGYALRGEDVSALACAVQKSDRAKVLRLLSLGAEFESGNMDRRPAVFSAPPDIGFLEWLRSRGARFDVLSKTRSTALHAISIDSEAVLDWLLDQGIEVNASDQSGHTPLAAQVRKIDGAMVLAMVQRGARPDALDSSGMGPISHAIRAKNASAIKALVDAGVDCKQRVGLEHESFLHHTIRFGVAPADVMETFRKCGVEIESINAGGETALHLAAQFAATSGLQVIAWQRLPLDAKTPAGNTALHLLASKPVWFLAPSSRGQGVQRWLSRSRVAEKLASISILLALGARKDIPDAAGRLPFQVVSPEAGQEDVIRLLQPAVTESD